MNGDDVNTLRAKALALLRKREAAPDLTLVHVASEAAPSGRWFRFSAIRPDEPNGPRFTVVLDETGNEVDVDRLPEPDRRRLFRRPIRLDRDRLRLLGSADDMVTITPTDNDLVLDHGELYGPETITVSIPASTPAQKVDVYLLADTTGSMRDVLGAIKASSNEILTALDGLGLDVAFGVGNYRDFPSPNRPVFEHQLSPTTDVAQARAALDQWSTGGGGDLPEGQLLALYEIAEDRDGRIGWRFDAKRIVVWFGDEPGHDPVCAAISGRAEDITLGRVVGRLAAQNITVIAISTTTGQQGLDGDPAAGAFDYVGACGEPGGFPGQATILADATGGRFLADIEPTAIVNVIIDALTDAALTINSVRLDPAGSAAAFVESISPTQYGPLSGTEDHELRFDVTFRGTEPCRDDGPQVVDGYIAVVVDGNVVGGQKQLRVTVPQCRRIVEIEGSPSASVAGRNLGPNTIPQINVLARSTTDSLLWWSHNGDPTNAANWTPVDRGRPNGRRVSENPFAFTDRQDNVARLHDHVHALVKGDGGHLHQAIYDGSTWSDWIDSGQPHMATVVTSPTAYNVGRSLQYDSGEPGYLTRLVPFTFVWGSDGRLHDHHDQVWFHHGGPPTGVEVASAVGVPGNTPRGLQPFEYAFVVGNDTPTPHLYVRHSTDERALSWSWTDLGSPTPEVGPLRVLRPGIVWYTHDGTERLYTFVHAGDGHLWVNVWRGSFRTTDAGFWADQGTPPTVTAIRGAPSVVTYGSSVDQIYAFVRGGDDELHVNHWDAVNGVWRWTRLGRPSDATIRSDPAAVVCEHPDASDAFYVFVRGNNDHLYMCHVDAALTSPQWKDLS